MLATPVGSPSRGTPSLARAKARGGLLRVSESGRRQVLGVNQGDGKGDSPVKMRGMSPMKMKVCYLWVCITREGYATRQGYAMSPVEERITCECAHPSTRVVGKGCHL